MNLHLRVIVLSFILSAKFANAAIDIIFDYSYDTANYFGDEQRYVMEQVAYVFESRITSSFTSTNLADYPTANPINPRYTFTTPTTGGAASVVPGATTSENNVIGEANELVIFLGARSRGVNPLADATPGGMAIDGIFPGDTWYAAVQSKDTSTNFEPRMGASSVNTDANFYYDTDLTTHADAVSSGKTDFYSVMVHEIGHIMGFTSSNAFANYSSGNTSWTGTNARAEYNNQNVPLNGNPHWGNALTQGNVNCACHPSMQPSISSNKRTSFSALDFALLKDVGYSISATPTGTNIGGTYTDPDWGGSYYIPVSETYADWLGGGGGGAGGGGGGGGVGGSAAPEPAYIFTLLGGALAFLGGRKNLQKIKAIFRFA